MKHYQFSKVTALTYLLYIGSGTDNAPGLDSLLDYTSCSKSDLFMAGTSEARDSFSFETAVADGLGSCGVQVVRNLIFQITILLTTVTLTARTNR